jgi:hypothetical protein
VVETKPDVKSGFKALKSEELNTFRRAVSVAIETLHDKVESCRADDNLATS